MSTIVQKYGGSSVADPEKLKKVAERIMRTRAAGYNVVVVVSAIGDTTDDLLSMARQVSSNPDRRELDMLLSAGERISMALLSMAIRELGGDAISFTGSQSGIITNDRHIDARIIEVRPFRVQDELARGRIVVIAGYQGVSYRREVTTLGRGGSDTTAVAMAAALGADWCEICSDVDGVYSADPRIVPAAQLIPLLSYEETQEMAERGARVLNAQAVEFAKDRNIAIYARSSASEILSSAADGTVVRRFAPRPPGSVVGVTSEGDLLQIESTRPDRILEQMDALKIPGKQVQIRAGEQGCISLIISKENLHHETALRKALGTIDQSLTWHQDLGALSIIGAGINTSHQKIREGSQALIKAGIPYGSIATSSFRVTWTVPEQMIEQGTRLLHRLFVEEPADFVP
jgi:aspartate kinase